MQTAQEGDIGMKLAEIAKEIDTYLQYFSKYYPKRDDGHTLFYMPCARPAGRYVRMKFITYHGGVCVSKEDAIRYLEWLKSGNIGTYYTMQHRG